MLNELLGYMRGLQMLHHVGHWVFTEDYGDHLLFERLYDAMGDEIDTLAEKIVGAGASIDPEEHASLALKSMQAMQGGSMLERAYSGEKSLQALIKRTYDQLKATNQLSLGMDDYLMSLASAHEGHCYLIKQRMKGGASRTVGRPVALQRFRG